MQQMMIWMAVATLLLLALELLAGRHRGVYRKGDFKLLIGSLFLGRGVMAPLGITLISGVYSLLLPAAWSGRFADVPFWLGFPLVMLAGEFCFYWVHRWAHQPRLQPWLWKIHRTHHSGRHMNVLLNYRLNLSWFFIIPSGWVSGLALYFGMGDAVLGYVLFLQVWNLVTHSNFRWDDAVRNNRYSGPLFRALEHVFVSPGMHHTHHGYGVDGKNYPNFGTIISLYDWMFGTLHIPNGRPTHYGLPGKDLHWAEELFYPLVRMKPRAEAATETAVS